MASTKAAKKPANRGAGPASRSRPAEPPATARPGPGLAARLRLGVLVPTLLGLVAATYLTIEHFTGSKTLSCPETATINCQKVTTSSYSHVAGVPVALAGLIFFVVMAALVSPPAWSIRRLDVVRVAASAVGVVSVFYLLWAELFEIDAICLWCTVVHICTVWMFGAMLWYVTGRRGELDEA